MIRISAIAAICLLLSCNSNQNKTDSPTGDTTGIEKPETGISTDTSATGKLISAYTDSLGKKTRRLTRNVTLRQIISNTDKSGSELESKIKTLDSITQVIRNLRKDTATLNRKIDSLQRLQ